MPYAQQPCKCKMAVSPCTAPLQALFGACGPVTVRMHTDKHSGKPKGFAHVLFGGAQQLSQCVRFKAF